MKNYYVLSNGRVKRESNTLVIEQQSTGAKRPIPIEDVESLFVFGEVDVNSKVLNFLSQKRVPMHVFNYYGHYAGTYHPREYLHSGYLVVQQAAHYLDPAKRIAIAKEFVAGAGHSILRTVAYYARRKGAAGEAGEASEPAGEIAPAEAEEVDVAVDEALKSGASDAVAERGAAAGGEAEAEGSEVEDSLESVHAIVSKQAAGAGESREVGELMGFEGKMRERYYSAWKHILIGDWSLERRVRRPPDNELNALISFGNMWLYTICVGEIYRTQLTPTIAYLHEPGERRFSLALDVSELFKPLIVDRTIFRLVNNRQIDTDAHFDKSMDGCFLTDAGKQVFLRELEAKLATTIRHRRLSRHVSYRHLIRLECYKLVRHLTGVEAYRAFRTWW
jgi:CRISPR-associated protein Cas1